MIRRTYQRIRGLAVRPIELLKWSINWWRVWKTLPVMAWIHGADCFRRADYRTAAAHYLKGLQKHPTHRAAFCAQLDFAYCLYRIGNFTEAAKALSKITLTRSPIKDAFLLLARIQLVTGDFNAAISTLHRGMISFRKDHQIALAYINCVINMKGTEEQLEEALNLLEALRARTDLNDPLTVSLDAAAACYEVRYGSYERGQQLLSRVIASGCAPFDAILLRGETMVEEGMVLAGRGLIGRAMTMSPADPRPAIALAESYLNTGDFSEPKYAVQLATTACQLSQWQNVDALATLVEAYTAAGEPMVAELIQERLRSVVASREIDLGRIQEAEVQISRIRSAKLD